MIRSQVILIASALVIIDTAGCVRNSIYEAVVKETEATAAELQFIRAEKATLAQQADELEKLNDVTITEIERTLEAAQAIRRNTETQKREASANYGRLNQTIAWLVKQQAFLRSKLSVEKENSAAMKELVDVYKDKIQEAPIAGAADTRNSEVARVALPSGPLKVQKSEVLPAPVPLSPRQPVSASTPPLQKPVAEPAKSTEPTESGLFTTIADWILSVWRFLFS